MSMADTSYGSQTLTALFDTQAEADRAVSRLRSAGIPDSSIRVTGGSSMGMSSSTTSSDAGMSSGMSGGSGSTSYSDQNKGFWESLGDFFFPDEDRHTYAQSLSRGSILVTVSNYDASYYDTIVDILDDEGSVDLDARESEFRSSGMGYQGSTGMTGGMTGGVTGAVSGAVGGAAAAVGSALSGDSTRGTVYDDGMRGSGTVGTATDVTTSSDYGDAGVGVGAAATRADDLADRTMTTTSTTTGAANLSDDGTVKVVEENIAVGKREVEGGRVRVRAYVREQPVQADVQLRSTRVMVERRPVNRAVNPGDLNLQDRVLEAHETSEQAVVAKEARVVEEIGLRQESEVHTETVQDTVRRTEVEVEDERTGEVTRITGDGTTSGTSGSGSTGR